MSSHVQDTGNPSSQQAQLPEPTPENALFSTLTLSFLPYYDGINQLANTAVCLLENVKGQCDISSDFATASACDPYAVVEFKARSLVNQYDNLSYQVSAAIELIEADAVRCNKLQREKDQLQKRLFSMERELNEAIEVNEKFTIYIQELEKKLGFES